MRWFFLLLLLLNVGYVTWELNREHPQHASKVVLPKGVERIVLLRELEPETAVKEDIAQVSTPVSVQVPAAKLSDADAKSQQQSQTKKTETQPAQLAVIDEGTASEAANTLAAIQDDKPIEKPIAKPAVDLCYTLGPFSEMKTLRLVTREIKDYVVEASFRSKVEQQQTMFRVFVRPVGSKQEAKAMIKELVSNNIRDYFIITDGPNKNGISLGFFSDKSRAYRHADRVRKLGFDATAEPVFRSYTIYWLDYRIKAGNEIPQQIFDDHLENSSQRLNRACG